MMEKEQLQVVAEIRRQIFAWQIDTALAQTAALIESLLANGMANPLLANRVATAIMAAIDQKDYLLFADLVYFEIPALGHNGQGDLA